MIKTLITIIFFFSLITSQSYGSPVKNGSGSMGIITPIAIFGLLNLIPANYEYNRHEKDQKSFSSIYWGGFLGGALGSFIGIAAFGNNDILFYGSMLTGIIAGNRLGYKNYEKHKKTKINFFPSLKSKNLNINLELKF